MTRFRVIKADGRVTLTTGERWLETDDRYAIHKVDGGYEVRNMRARSLPEQGCPTVYKTVDLNTALMWARLNL